MDGGIALYSSTDLYSWTFEGVVVNVFNCTSNTTRAAARSGGAGGGYQGGYPPPSCNNGNGLDLERPKVVQCGGPGSGGKFVMWVRGTGYGNSPQLLGVLTSDSPTGPFEFVSNKTGSDDPFVTVGEGAKNYPPGYQYADATLFQDPATHKTYVYWRTRMTKGVDGTATGFRAMELTTDCLGVVRGSDTRVTATANREGPAMFVHEGTYYLYVSGTMGWSPTAMYLYSASSPLGNLSGSSMDDHYWHAYTKGAAGNSSAWNKTWTVRTGYLTGATFGTTNPQQLTFAAAQALCARAQACGGFNFVDFDAAPAASKALSVTFRAGKVAVYPEAEVGLQPPPIPVPGQPGNTAPQQPGAWAFDSQSTYVLRNPHYTTGSKVAPFVYVGHTPAAQPGPHTVTSALS